jgi:hypothetical protein
MGRPLLWAVGILLLVAVAVAIAFSLISHIPVTNYQLPTR